MSKHRQLIEFNSTDCCALREGFRQNQEAVYFLTTLVPPERLALYQDILDKTLRLCFSPSKEARQVFSLVAQKEEARLKNSGRTFCGVCAAEEHLASCNKIIKLLAIKEAGGNGQ